MPRSTFQFFTFFDWAKFRRWFTRLFGCIDEDIIKENQSDEESQCFTKPIKKLGEQENQKIDEDNERKRKIEEDNERKQKIEEDNERKRKIEEDNERRKIEKENERKRKLIKELNIVSFQPPSLINSGATCYLNSALQGISACDIFVNEINKLSLNEKYKSLRKLNFFKELIDILNECSTGRMEISRNPIFQHWNKPGQQDSYEVLAYALNEVYNELRKYKEQCGDLAKMDLNAWLQVQLPMRYTLLYRIKCGSCSMISFSPFQSDLALHVTIPKKEDNLDKLLDLYFDEDLIEDYECDKKGCNGNGTKRIARMCRPLPKTICIHLQRTYWNGWQMVKINGKVYFKNSITIKSNFILKKSNLQVLENIDTNNKITEDKDLTNEDELIDEFINDIINKAISQIRESNNITKNTYLRSSVCSEKSKEDVGHLERNRLNIRPNEPGDLNAEDNGYKEGSKEGVGHLERNRLNIRPNEPGDLNAEDNDYKEGSKEGFINEVNDKDVNKNEKDEIYGLVSVIEHSGSVYGGHYICYKKVKDQWFLTNDSYVRKVSENEVLNCQAYIMFYEAKGSNE